jgi:hypothetical protein
MATSASSAWVLAGALIAGTPAGGAFPRRRGQEDEVDGRLRLGAPSVVTIPSSARAASASSGGTVSCSAPSLTRSMQGVHDRGHSVAHR